MDYKFYIGVDVSKHTLDFTVLKDGNWLLHETVNNEKKAIEVWLKKIMALYKAGGKKTLYCIENTGLYQMVLLDILQKRKFPVWVESALQIHLSIGVRRGKSDQTDSDRIAHYAYTNYKKAKLWQPPREVIKHLKQLRSLRERLSTILRQLKQGAVELQGFTKQHLHEEVSSHCEASLAAVKADIIKVEGSIQRLIKTDERLCQLFDWITSVYGIGPVLATEMIITTNEFKNFSCAKKFACYCGVAPFRYTSGVNVHSKAKVSKRANQRMKKLLHIAAMSCVRGDNEYKQYYDRRVKQGMNKTSVLNVIRNKLIKRAFACVNGQRFYVRSSPPLSIRID